MSTQSNTPIDVVGLREKLSVLTYEKLREEAITLGVESVWKGGVNKTTAVENVISAYVAKVELEKQANQDTGSVDGEEDLDNSIPEGEYDIDEETLIDYPQLIELGFSIGDVLVVEGGKPWTKKDLSESTDGISTIKTIEEVDKEIKEANGGREYSENLDKGDGLINGIPVEEINKELANLNGGVPHDIEKPEVAKSVEEIEVEEEIETGEYVPEIIDETKFTEEELQENIDICQANCSQAIPETRIFLLRKIDALTLALERKRK